MRAFALALVVVCSSAFAQSAPADAPIIMAKGDAAPASGLFLSEPAALSAARRLADAEGELEVLHAHKPIPAWIVVLIAVVAAGAGVGVTLGVVAAVAPKP